MVYIFEIFFIISVYKYYKKSSITEEFELDYFFATTGSDPTKTLGSGINS